MKIPVFLGPTSHLPNGVPISDVDPSHEAKTKLTFSLKNGTISVGIKSYSWALYNVMIFIQTLNALFCSSKSEIGPDNVCFDAEIQIKYEEKTGKKEE